MKIWIKKTTLLSICLLQILLISNFLYSQETMKYTIKEGEIGNKIAKNHNISLEELAKLNPDVNWKKLQPGKTLNVPDTTKKEKASEEEPVETAAPEEEPVICSPLVKC